MITSDVGPWGIVPRALIRDMAPNMTAVGVYALLSSHADRQTDDGWTGARRDLADSCGVSLSTFDRALKVLVDAGWVDVHHNFNERKEWQWSRYFVRTSVTRGLVTGDDTSSHPRLDLPSPVTGRKTDPSTDPSTESPPTPSTVIAVVTDDGGFESFYRMYPRKEGKRRAATAYSAALKRGATSGQIEDGLKRAMIKWKAEDRQSRFVPHPTTWLNGDCFNDQLTVDIARDGTVASHRRRRELMEAMGMDPQQKPGEDLLDWMRRSRAMDEALDRALNEGMQA